MSNEHTPLDDLVSRMHIHFGAANAMGDDFAADDFANVIRILENMPAKLAAAEQRGAARGKVEGLREAADEAGSWGPACINAALAIRRSADLLEGVE